MLSAVHSSPSLLTQARTSFSTVQSPSWPSYPSRHPGSRTHLSSLASMRLTILYATYKGDHVARVFLMPGFLHIAEYSVVPIVLSQLTWFHSFLWLNNNPLPVCAPFSLSIHRFTNIVCFHVLYIVDRPTISTIMDFTSFGATPFAGLLVHTLGASSLFFCDSSSTHRCLFLCILLTLNFLVTVIFPGVNEI